MCCINILLTVYPFTFNKFCICLLLYMTVTHYQNKMLYNKVFLIQTLWIWWCFHAYTESIQNLIMQIRLFSIILNPMKLTFLWFSRLPDIALKTLNIHKKHIMDWINLIFLKILYMIIDFEECNFKFIFWNIIFIE